MSQGIVTRLKHWLPACAAFLFLLSLGTQLGAQEREEIPRLVAQYQTKMDRYLIKDSSVADYFMISGAGISTFATPGDRDSNKVEFHLFWDELPAFRAMSQVWGWERNLDWFKQKGTAQYPEWLLDSIPAPKPEFEAKGGDKPLKGMRIALDPGHVGGSMRLAKMERKFVRMRKGVHENFPAEIQFNEGNLTLCTALALQEMLEEAGAEVVLTRDKIGMTAFGQSFEHWKKHRFKRALIEYGRERQLKEEDLRWWLTKATDKQIFHRIFKYDEFRERARIINDFQPHLTLIIHYNVEESNEPDDEWYMLPTEKNFNMAFIPGSFMENETDEPIERMQFLNKLIREDVEESERASSFLVREFALATGVPIIDHDTSLRYIRAASILTNHQGVYARNLSMTRLVNSPLVFGETLYQDNIRESLNLFSIDYQVGPYRTSRRVVEVARGYFLGVINYVKDIEKKDLERIRGTH